MFNLVDKSSNLTFSNHSFNKIEITWAGKNSVPFYGKRSEAGVEVKIN